MSDYNSEKQSLKFSGNIPEGYDISQIQFTFDFIYLVLKRDSSIDNAIQGVANEYNLSESWLLDYLIENNYVLNKANKNEYLKKLKSYNTKSLKKILKRNGLKTSGKRERIEQRIIDSGLLENDYYLSSKSKVFYTNKRRRNDIFNEYLCNDYYFKEFNEFYMDNYRKKEARIPVEFIKLHINKSIDEKNHDNYLYNNQVMANHYFKKKNCRKMLEYMLKCYCMNINPIWKIDDLKGHTGIFADTYNTLLSLQNQLGKNAIINTFYPVWDSFNFESIIISKYDAYRYLKDILNYKDYNKINQDLDNRFYSNEDLKIKKIIQKTLFDF